MSISDGSKKKENDDGRPRQERATGAFNQSAILNSVWLIAWDDII